MKRVKVVFMLGMFVVTCSSMAFGLVITDNFDTDHDYNADGVAGTVWDGLLLNGGKTGVSDAVGVKCAAEVGVLTMQSYGGNWENDQADGYFLYMNVDGSKDFIADVYLSNFVWVNYHDVGIMARKIDGPLENHVDHRYFPRWGNGNTLRSVIDGVTVIKDLGPDDPFLSYLRLTKTGAIYTVYASGDGITFVEISSIERLDMNNVDLQVGLYQGTYSLNTGSVSFDNFSLEVIPEPCTISLLAFGAMFLLKKNK